MNQTSTGVKFLVTLTFLAMVTVNALANILPINGVNTGQVSDSYPDLFAPAALTFSIWGLIYFLLALYTLYQLGLFRTKNISYTRNMDKGKTFNKIGLLFSLSSLANGVWIFAWHYRNLPLSMALMVVILLCLIFIQRELIRTHLSTRERIFVRLPFSIYFGWITVATIANATALLVSLKWDRFGLAETVWTVIILLVGLAISAVTMVKNRDKAYGLVIVWAYAGIIFKHLSPSGFNGQYPVITIAAGGSIVLILVLEVYLWFAKPRWN